MKSIFITGIDGFIGSNLTRFLVRSGDYNIVGLIKDHRAMSGSLYEDIDVVNKINFVTSDILNANEMIRIVSDYEVDTIFNFASVSIVRICETNPFYALAVNVVGSANMLEAARQIKTVKHLVNFTSDKSYGSSDQLPYLEDKTPLRGNRPYECTKSMIDLWTQTYQNTYDVPVTVVRSANVFGPYDNNFSRLIPNSCIRIANNQNPFLWSEVANYIREFVYIEDVINFLINLVEKGKEDPNVIKSCYNLGSGNVFTVKELVEKLIKISDKDVELELKQKDLPFKEIKEQYLSLEKTKEKLEWQAKYIGDFFDEALRDTYEYYKNLKMKS